MSLPRRFAALPLLTISVLIGGASVQACGRAPYAASRSPADEALQANLVKNCENAVAGEVRDTLKDTSYSSGKPVIAGDRLYISGRLSGPSADGNHVSIPYTCNFKRIGESWQLEQKPVIR